MRIPQVNILLLFAMATTVVSVVFYKVLPPRVYSIAPSLEWRAELFSSESEGPAHWIDKEAYRWQCEAGENRSTNSCGINFSRAWDFTSGHDLSPYSRLKIYARFSGKVDSLVIFLRNYNPTYSNNKDANSAKFMHIPLSTREFSTNEPVVIDLKEFMVAQWWLRQRGLDRKLLSPEFGNVTTIGFDFGDDIDKMTFDIESMVFEGPLIQREHWYLGILAFWMLLVCSCVVKRYIALLGDKKHFEKESNKYKKLSNIDALTHALNRTGVEKEFDNIVLGRQSKSIGVVLMDIDHFKTINDRLGHDMGDAVLKIFTEIIQDKIRSHDVFGRWGGEEFVLITPDADDLVAQHVAEKLGRLVESHPFFPDSPLQVTVSFGVTSVRGKESVDDAIKRADIALYKAKSLGRNCAIIAD